LSYVATPAIREAFLGFPSLKSNRRTNFLGRNFRGFYHRTILAERSRDLWLLKMATTQEAEIVHEFDFERHVFSTDIIVTTTRQSVFL
jgi:hypothetical protein